MREKTERFTARALIVSDDNEILLLSVKLPWMIGETWTLPGGGIEAEETAAECARREIHEEVGYQYNGDLVPCWHASIEFTHKDSMFITHEKYFAARVATRFEPTMANMMDYEKDFSLELKWWSIDELRAHQTHFSPKQLPQMALDIMSGSTPTTSIALVNPMPENYRG